ncbi:MAG TPA: hypothetical protein VF317_06235 [Dermatophilaceae bacterium]
MAQRGGIEWTSILVRLPADVKAEIVELALRKDMSQSALINDAIFRYLQAERLMRSEGYRG